METLKSAVQSVSEAMFPGIKFSYRNKINHKSEEVMSSLPLQMCLFFNVSYSAMWAFTRIYCLAFKFSLLSQLYRILLISILTVMIPVEAARLYLGYIGNLTEKVPELAGFWLLTLFLQFPLHSLSTFNREYVILPVERVIDVILMIFIILEIIIGYIAVKVITKYQAEKFKLQMMKYDIAACSSETIVD